MSPDCAAVPGDTGTPLLRVRLPLCQATRMEFFILTRKPRTEYGGTYDTQYLVVDGARYGDAPRCRLCARPTGARTWLPPFRVEIELFGRQFGDVVTGFGGGAFLVSPRFEDVVRSQHLTGLEGFEPVEVAEVSSRSFDGEPPAYRRVDISPSETAIDVEQTGIERREPIQCAHCLTSDINGIRSIVIDEATWRGEDVFSPRGIPGLIAVSERFRDVCMDNEITNITLVSAHDFVETYGLSDQ